MAQKPAVIRIRAQKRPLLRAIHMPCSVSRKVRTFVSPISFSGQ